MDAGIRNSAVAVLLTVLASAGWTQGPPAAGKPCLVKEFSGSRFHPGRNTTMQVMAIQVASEADGRFSGKLRYTRGGSIRSEEPFTGSLSPTGELRIDSEFNSSDAKHAVRIRGTVANGEFTGKEGNYGDVTAKVSCQ